jgi:hypothetical protein
MKNFYEMLRILEVITPSGYTLTPEELEDYENEKSPMYKALFLKDIDAKRKAEQERNPEAIAAKEEKRRQEEYEKARYEIEKKQKEEDPDYVFKVLGIIVDSIEKSDGICKSFLNGVAGGLGIKKDGDKWKWRQKWRGITDREIQPYNEKVKKPVAYSDKDWLRSAVELSFFALEDSKEDGGCEIILDILYKLGVKPYLKVGDIVNFDGRHHTTKDGVEINEKVRVSKSGLIDSLNNLLKKALVKKL